MELSVADNIGDTVFVAFDLDMTRLTSIPAAEAAQIIVVCSLISFELKYNLCTMFSSENRICVCLQGVGVNIVWKLRFLSLSLTLLGRPSLSSLN